MSASYRFAIPHSLRSDSADFKQSLGQSVARSSWCRLPPPCEVLTDNGVLQKGIPFRSGSKSTRQQPSPASCASASKRLPTTFLLSGTGGGGLPLPARGFWRLLGILYLVTCCGAYATEELVGAGQGPLFCLLGLMVLPCASRCCAAGGRG